LDDIVAEKVAAALAARDAEQGIEKPVARRTGDVAGRMAGAGVGGAKRKLYMTDDIKREAARNHMDPETWLRLKQG
jgi:hypothetical protein